MNDTIRLTEGLVIRAGFIPQKRFGVGSRNISDFIDFGATDNVYVHIKTDKNPARYYNDFEILIGLESPTLYLICGEMLEILERQGSKLELVALTPYMKANQASQYIHYLSSAIPESQREKITKVLIP